MTAVEAELRVFTERETAAGTYRHCQFGGITSFDSTVAIIMGGPCVD